MDPLAKDYPWYSPYQFAGNKPIVAVDLDGAEEFYVTDYFNANGQLYMTEIHLVSNQGTQQNVQTVHRSQARYDAAGNVTVTYVGSTTGTWAPAIPATPATATTPARPATPGVAGPFASPAEAQTAMSPAPGTNAAGNWVMTSPGEFGVTSTGNRNFSVPYTNPQYQTAVYNPDPSQPNNPYAPNTTLVPNTLQEVGEYQTILVPRVATPNPATSAYVPQGTNAVPQNMNLRTNPAGPPGNVLNGGTTNGPAMGATTAPPQGSAPAPTQVLQVPTQQAQDNNSPPTNPAPLTNTITIF